MSVRASSTYVSRAGSRVSHRGRAELPLGLEHPGRRPAKAHLPRLPALRRTHSIIDSHGFVEASVRRSWPRTPRRVTVSVSTRPSDREAAAPGWERPSSGQVIEHVSLLVAHAAGGRASSARARRGPRFGAPSPRRARRALEAAHRRGQRAARWPPRRSPRSPPRARVGASAPRWCSRGPPRW